MSTVPRNKLQQNIANQTQEAFAPDPFGVMQAVCRIVTVYDSETLGEVEISDPGLAGALFTNPGWLHAEVEIVDTGEMYVLPFEDPEDLIYLVYGNRVLLEGRLATIVYVNQDVQNGSIVLRRTLDKIHLPLDAQAQCYDVGFVI